MRAKNHIRIYLYATFFWLIFWFAGLPFYYQQYSGIFMIWVLVLVLLVFAMIFYYILGKISRVKRIYFALWLAFYFSLPLAAYNALYCGLYLGYGLSFLSRFWYLTVYYILPWILLPVLAIIRNRQNSYAHSRQFNADTTGS